MTDAHSTDAPSRRQRAVALALGIPVIVTTLGLCVVETWRLASPQSPLFAEPKVYSLADAIERHDTRQAYAFIRAGQDPNGLMPARHEAQTKGRTVLVSPLLWAVAMDDSRAVMMLLGYGAAVNTADGEHARCLAQQFGNDEIAGILAHYGAPAPDPPCARVPRDAAPLLAYTAAASGDDEIPRRP